MMRYMSLKNKIKTSRPYLVLLLLIMVSTLQAQNQEVLISEEFSNISLITFIETLEQKYPLQFFYEKKTLEGIMISADFQETPLKACMEEIFLKEGLNFYISQNKQISIYTGAAFTSLFPDEPQEEVIYKRSTPEEKISRDMLKRRQYEMVNIGLPGHNTSGFAIVSGTLTSFENGQAVIGANVYNAETRQGVITNNEGYYEIQLTVGNQTISFGSIDMYATSRIINLYSDGSLDVVLETKYNLLEDVVVVGRGKGNLGQVHLGIEEINL